MLPPEINRTAATNTGHRSWREVAFDSVVGEDGSPDLGNRRAVTTTGSSLLPNSLHTSTIQGTFRSTAPEGSVGRSKALSESGLGDKDPSLTGLSPTAGEKPFGKGASGISGTLLVDPIGGDASNPPDSWTSPLADRVLTAGLADLGTAANRTGSLEPLADAGASAEAETLSKTAPSSSPTPSATTNTQANPTQPQSEPPARKPASKGKAPARRRAAQRPGTKGKASSTNRSLSGASRAPSGASRIAEPATTQPPHPAAQPQEQPPATPPLTSVIPFTPVNHRQPPPPRGRKVTRNAGVMNALSSTPGLVTLPGNSMPGAAPLPGRAVTDPSGQSKGSLTPLRWMQPVLIGDPQHSAGKMGNLRWNDNCLDSDGDIKSLRSSPIPPQPNTELPTAPTGGGRFPRVSATSFLHWNPLDGTYSRDPRPFYALSPPRTTTAAAATAGYIAPAGGPGAPAAAAGSPDWTPPTRELPLQYFHPTHR